MRLPKGLVLQRCDFQPRGPCEHTGKAGNEVHICFHDLSKAYDCVNRPLAWEHFSGLGFLQEWYSSPKTFMTTLCVQCKQTGADKAAGFGFPQALSKAMYLTHACGSCL